MNHPKIIILAGLSAYMATHLAAEPEAVNVPHVFSAGEPASAEQVNQNFATLAAALNDLSERIEALENNGSGNPTGEAIGTYRLVSTQSEFSGQNQVATGYAELNIYVAEGQLQMNADNTWTVSLQQLEQRISAIGDYHFNDENEKFGAQKLQLTGTPDGETLNGTWMRQGSLITLNVGTETILECVVSLGGDVLLAPNNEVGNDKAMAGIFIAIRTSE